MKTFWIDDKDYRNQHLPWHDRRLGEIAHRNIPGNDRIPQKPYEPGRVQQHISERLAKHLRKVSSPMSKVYIDQVKES